MDGIAELFGVWLAIVSSQAGEPIALNPPAERTAISDAETELGHDLPADLRALYLVADGQTSPSIFRRGPSYTPLFYDEYRFLSLEDALLERERQQDESKSLPGDKSPAWADDWFPFAAGADGEGLLVDLRTDDDGGRGRVRKYGPMGVSDSHFLRFDKGPSLYSFLRYRIQIEDEDRLDTSGIEELFAGWLALQAADSERFPKESGAVRFALNPPADSDEIRRVEHELGHSLTADLHTLYTMANGQQRPSEDTPRSRNRPVFLKSGRFLALEDALEERRRALESDDDRFEPSWFPVASNDDGGGLAVDLASPASTGRARIHGYGPAFGDPDTQDASLHAWLETRMDDADRLWLYRNSDDPLLRHLRHWYLDRVESPNRSVEATMQYVLEPWLMMDPRGEYRMENYLGELATRIAFDVHCHPPAESTLEGVRIANDWLYEQNMITERRYRQAEAIRVDRDGARTESVSDFKFWSNDNGNCFMSRLPD